ncbi:MAG: hypothetical protein AAF526_07055, partial [Pseudomonadota bacterium]
MIQPIDHGAPAMKIVENTDEKLVLVSRPWFLAGFVWCMGLFMLANGVFGLGDDTDGIGMRLLAVGIGCGACWIAWQFLPFVSVVFDRARGQLLHRSHRPVRPGWFILDLDRIYRARLEADWGGKSGRTTRVVLEIKDDIVPLEYGFGSRDDDDVVDAINEWL